MNYPAVILSDAPLGYWRLGESSGTSGVDASGNGHAGTYAGGPTLGVSGALAGDTNTAATFDGSSSYFSAPSVTAPMAGDWAVECWFKASSYQDAKTLLAANDAGVGWKLYQYSGVLYFGTDNVSLGVNAPTHYSDGAWHHVVASRTAGQSTRLYVDGADVTNGSHADTPAAMSGLYVGGEYGFDLFAGAFDEVAFYGHALSAARVLAHYAAGKTAPKGGPILRSALIGRAG